MPNTPRPGSSGCPGGSAPRASESPALIPQRRPPTTRKEAGKLLAGGRCMELVFSAAPSAPERATLPPSAALGALDGRQLPRVRLLQLPEASRRGAGQLSHCKMPHKHTPQAPFLRARPGMSGSRAICQSQRGRAAAGLGGRAHADHVSSPACVWQSGWRARLFLSPPEHGPSRPPSSPQAAVARSHESLRNDYGVQIRGGAKGPPPECCRRRRHELTTTTPRHGNVWGAEFLHDAGTPGQACARNGTSHRQRARPQRRLHEAGELREKGKQQAGRGHNRWRALRSPRPGTPARPALTLDMLHHRR